MSKTFKICTGTLNTGYICGSSAVDLRPTTTKLGLNTNDTPIYSDYTYYNNQNHVGDDIVCNTDKTPDQCKTDCDKNSNCKAFNIVTPLTKKLCCLKTNGNNLTTDNSSDFYIKK